MRTNLVRTCSIAVFLFFASQPGSAQLENLLQINFVDVGQGDAIWIQTPTQTLSDGTLRSLNILIDGGPDRGSGNQLLAYLQALGLPAGSLVDYVICTHPHTDHYKGLIDLLERYEVAITIEPGYPKGGQYNQFLTVARNERVGGQPAELVNLRSLPTKVAGQYDIRLGVGGGADEISLG